MINRISFREIFAWITLAIALLLLSVSFAFAQTKSINVEKEDGKVHIKISKTENGKTVNIDTSFAFTDDIVLEKIIDDLSGENNRLENKQIVRSKVKVEGKDGKKRKQISFDKDFSFNIDIPEIDSEKLHDCISNSYAYSYSHSYDDETDSLDDKNHVIIIGDKDEAPPVFEKVITSKNGKQIFVYKRSVSPDRVDSEEELSADDESNSDLTGIKNLRYYPNPSNGKFKLVFRLDEKSDVTIKILDSNSKVVFNDKVNGFQGEYSREIDLSAKSTGNYMLKIIHGKNSITKKIVVN